MVFLGLVRIAVDEQPVLELARLRARHAKLLGDERRVLERVALGDAFVLYAAQVEGFVRERMCGPRRPELAIAARVVVDAGEVDPVEVAQLLAGLRGEVGVIRRSALLVEPDAARFATGVHEARQEARAVDADFPSRELRSDGGEPPLLVHPALMTRESERRKGTGDGEAYRDESHLRRIGIAPDGIESQAEV